MSAGTRTLSEAARHVVLPAGIVSTGWPAVRQQCSELGIQFDPWQDGAGRAILAKRADGSYAASIGGVVISIPRQVGKTYLIGAIVFALCLLFPGLTVIWTAHRARTGNETFAAMQGMVRRRKIAPHILKVALAAGEEEIGFHNGSRILFGARERGFGRGFAEVDVIIFDEAQIMTEAVMDDMVPAANVAKNPLLIFTGTPPRPKDPGEVFASKRREALSGEDQDTLYIEISADDGADPDDRAQYAKANPSYPHRTPLSSMLRMRKNLTPESFLREALGIWQVHSDVPRVISLPQFVQLQAPAPVEGEVAYGVRFSVDGAWMGVAAAVMPDEGGPVFVEMLDKASTSVGLAGVTDWLVDRWRDSAAIVIDGKSGAGALQAELVAAGVRASRIRRPTVEDVITANAGLVEAVRAGQIRHAGQPGLIDSVAGAARRDIGTAGGWGFRPVSVDDDVLPVECVALALWGVTHAKRGKVSRGRTGSEQRGRRTGRKAVVL